MRRITGWARRRGPAALAWRGRAHPWAGGEELATAAVRGARRTGTLTGMSAAFIFLMVILKIPIFMLLYIVWYAIKSPPQPEPVTGEDGGSKRPLSPRPRHPQHPRPALPRNPRRGPHGAPQVAPPARIRTRTVVARARHAEPHR